MSLEDRRSVHGATLIGVKAIHTLGADDGSVTDIFPPRSFAQNVPAIHVPLILLAAYLHGRDLRRRRSARARLRRDIHGLVCSNSV
jgi:hypothetical protein